MKLPAPDRPPSTAEGPLKARLLLLLTVTVLCCRPKPDGSATWTVPPLIGVGPLTVLAAPMLTVALPETLAAATVGPARLVVPPENVAAGIVLVLFSVTRPPETLSAVAPADAPAPTVTPCVVAANDVQRGHAAGRDADDARRRKS